eukprot:TRINITY_DN4719_c0_g1_i2.p1 TRINITY_DN4719_c0_g1~~TRINITY_DN4719_c0_g1_i2.p1  ORF type:complete len:508 (+),score=189.84 TRINITY_DN4719_c0_g1_i2:364-1887(+)
MTKETTTSGDGEAMWGERLSLMCTMYRSANGKFQEKTAKLCCKEKKKRKTVGEVRLNLGDFTGESVSQNTTFQLQTPGLKKNSTDASVGSLTVTIACKFIAPNIDDTPSDMTDIDNTSQMSFGEDPGSDEDEMAPKPVDGAVAKLPPTSPAISHSDQATRDRVAKLEEQLAEQEELVSDLRRQNTDLTIAASGTSSEQKSVSESLEDAQQEILRLQTAHRDLLQSETLATENAAAFKEQLVQVQMELETEKRESQAAANKVKLDTQTQVEQRQELERELEKAQAETQHERSEAEAARNSLLVHLEEAQAASKAAPEEGVQSVASNEGAEQLTKHLHEMLEMRGQELDGAKDRLQSFKEKLKEAQEELEGAETKIEQLNLELGEATEKHLAMELSVDECKANAAEEMKEAKQSKEVLEQRVLELEKAQAAQVSNPVDPEMEEHVVRIEGMLIEAKMAWAQAEEDKAMAELKARQLRDQLAKGRDLNLQFAKRMTKLEVKLSRAKEGKK